MPPINEALRSDIARLKRATKESPQKFTCILGREAALLINSNPKAIADAKKEVGGGAVVTGDCFLENGQFIFETPGAPPGTLAKALQLCIKNHAGITAKVETRQAGVGEEESDESESEEPLKAKVTAHVKTLQTRLAGLAKTAPQKVAPVQTKIAQAGAAFKSNHFEEAEQLLKEAEELL